MFESILSNNFDAVALLRYGRFDESSFLLRVALTAVQEANAVPLEGHAVAAQEAIVVSIPVEDCEGHLCPNKSRTTSGNETCCFDIFRRGFIFEGPQSLANSHRNACLCASVCLYNMALGMHLKGLTEGGIGYLRKASGLYEKVFSILSGFGPDSTDSACTLLLATVLNLIACEGELRGHSSTNEWKAIYSNLFTWATRTPTNPASVLNQPEELEIFTTSAVLFSNQKFTSAPAA